MKHIISFILCLLCLAPATAQDVLVVRRKDGSQQRIDNGIYRARISFFGNENEGEGAPELQPVVNPQPGEYGPLMQVADCGKFENYNGKSFSWKHYYWVTLTWNQVIPQVPYHLCIGRHPGVTPEDCDTTFVLPHDRTSVSTNIWNYSYHFLHGATYYYRIMVQLPYEQGGQQLTADCYGPEMSFRIPDLMAETDLIPEELIADGITLPSQAAWKAFEDRYFTNPELSRPSVLAWDRLWLKWMQTEQGRKADLLIEDHVFDDGIAHFVQTVPEAFYEWACNLEIVISQKESFSHYNYNAHQTQYVKWTQVTGVSPEWGLPDNSYVQGEDSLGTTNIKAVVNTQEAIPGVRYRLKIIFAPETQREQTEGNEGYFADNALKIGWHLPSQDSGGGTFLTNPHPEQGEFQNIFMASGTKVVTVTADDFTGGNGGIDLLLYTENRSSALNRKTRTSTLRIAEIRLTPIKE